MQKKRPPDKNQPAVKKPQTDLKQLPIRSPYDDREAPVYREHDDFREWLMRDSR